MSAHSFYPNERSPSAATPGSEYINLVPSAVRNLVKKAGRFFVKKKVADSNLPSAEEPTETSQTGHSDVSSAFYADNIWKVAQDRSSIMRDLDEIDRNDILCHRGLTVIADCVTGYEDIEVDGFEWALKQSNQKAIDILKALKDRCELGTDIWHITRSGVKFGEEFREVIVDGDMVIRRFQSLPAWTMFPNLNSQGIKTPGWYQMPELHNQAKKIPFQEWQIVPFVFGPRRGWYGTGLMTPARRTYRRLEKMHDGMAIARLIRAYDKLLHKVPVKPEWDTRRINKAIADYKQSITTKDMLNSEGNVSRRNSPFTVDTDIFIADDGSSRGGVSLLQAENVQLSHVEDVEYHLRSYLAAVTVPRKYLNMGRGEKGVLTDGSLTAEDVQFARTLRNTQAVVRVGFMRLARLALFFQGFDADQLGLRIRLPKISTMDALMDAKVTFTRAQAAEIFSTLLGGLPPEMIGAKYMELDEEEKETLRKFLDQMEKEQEAQAKADAAAEKAAISAVGATRTPDADGATRDPAAVRRAMNRGIARRAGSQIGAGRVVPRVQDLDAVSPYELADVLAHVRVMVQSELEKHGVRSNMGHEEHRLESLDAIMDTIASNGV